MSLAIVDALLAASSDPSKRAALWYPSAQSVALEEREKEVQRYWATAIKAIREVPAPPSDESHSAKDLPGSVPSDPAGRLDWFVNEARATFPDACNMSTLCVARRMNVREPGLETTANHQAAFLLSSTWKLVTPREAQAEADRGRLVIAALPATRPNDPGHTAIVMPQIKGRKVAPSGRVPDLYCPLVGGGAESARARDGHGKGANWVFSTTPDPSAGFFEAPIYYVRYFLAP